MPGRTVVAAVILSLALAGPGVADEGEGRSYRDGLDRLSEGARLLIEGLLADIAPMIDDLRGLVDDATLYHRPEVLPNGDIIIRRRRPQDSESLQEQDGVDL